MGCVVGFCGCPRPSVLGDGGKSRWVSSPPSYFFPISSFIAVHIYCFSFSLGVGGRGRGEVWGLGWAGLGSVRYNHSFLNICYLLCHFSFVSVRVFGKSVCDSEFWRFFDTGCLPPFFLSFGSSKKYLLFLPITFAFPPPPTQGRSCSFPPPPPFSHHLCRRMISRLSLQLQGFRCIFQS